MLTFSCVCCEDADVKGPDGGYGHVTRQPRMGYFCNAALICIAICNCSFPCRFLTVWISLAVRCLHLSTGALKGLTIGGSPPLPLVYSCRAYPLSIPLPYTSPAIMSLFSPPPLTHDVPIPYTFHCHTPPLPSRLSFPVFPSLI